MGGTPRKRIGYRQIAEKLRQRISAGEYGVGDVVPSENTIAEEFSVARATARNALNFLANEGVLHTVHGAGRFVADKATGGTATTKHGRIAGTLRQRILDGRLKVGDIFPSEAEVCAEFNVSRTTARAAFSELEREGYARNEKGRERVVAAADFRDDGDRSTAWVVYGETPIYENYWVTVTQADIQTPDGARFEHHKVYLPPAAMTAMVDDKGRVFMMWRHRFVSNTWNWELPGGVVENGEDPAVTAAREVLEETGYRPKGRLEHVVTFEPMIGTVTSPHHVYVAHGVEYVAPPTEVNEAQRTAWIPLERIPEIISRGEISNSGALVALFYLLYAKAKH